MVIKTKPFDVGKHFGDEVAQLDLVNDALSIGDVGYIAAALGTVAKVRGMSKVASDTGLNRQALHKALSEGGNPTLDTVLKVLSSLDLELQVKDRGSAGAARGTHVRLDVVPIDVRRQVTIADQIARMNGAVGQSHSQPVVPSRMSAVYALSGSRDRQFSTGASPLGRPIKVIRNAA